MTDSNLTIAIKAKDEASATLKNIKANVGGVEQSVKSANGIGNVLAGSLGGLAAGFGIGAAVAGITQMSSAVWELGQRGEQVAALKTSFDNLAQGIGASSASILATLRTTTGGMVSDADLMLAANRAMMLGVGRNAEEIAGLMQVAIERGRALGVSAQQAVNDIISGIGRMSPEVLDNLAITGAKSAFVDYAATVGKSAEALTEVEKKQALVNAALASANSGATPVVDKFAQMDASLQNAKDALGELFGPAVAVIAQNIADAAREATNALTEGGAREAAAQTQRSWASIAAELAAARVELEKYQQTESTVGSTEAKMLSNVGTYGKPSNAGDIEATKKRIAELEHELAVANALQQQIGATGSVYAGFTGATNASTAAANVNAAAIAQVKAQLEALGRQADVTGSALTSAFVGMAQVLGAAGALAGLNEKRRELIGLQQAWNYMGLSAEQIQFREAEWLQQTNEGLSGVRSSWELTTGRVEAHGAAVDTAAKAYDGLLSKVQGVLSSALGDVGVKAEDLLPRQDAINENARRLAAIAKEGLTGQSWLPEFQAEAPGAWADLVLKQAEGVDVKTAAAQLLRDFEDGLRPDLLDKGAAKDRVRRMILGDESMAAMAQEIATELAAEMGVSYQTALSAAQGSLGVKGDQSGQGGAWGDGFSQGAADGTVSTIVVKLEAQYSQLSASGKTAGTMWGTGFLTTVGANVPPELVSILVTLTTPGVYAMLQNATSQTKPPDQ